jgi:RNA polymerase sigma-70 factor (ECF subfamily)
MSSRERISEPVLRQIVHRRAEFLSFLQRRIGSAGAAEDVLQDALARAVERGGTIRASESAAAWFYRLLRNAIVDHARRRRAADRLLHGWAEEQQATKGTDEPLEPDVCPCVARLVDSLKPEYAAALRAVEVEDKPMSVFAKEAAITPNNAAVRLHRARAALAARVRKSCGTCATRGCFDCTCSRA